MPGSKLGNKEQRLRLVLALLLAAVGLVDNVTTWMAVSRGAAELNPIVKPFLGDPLAFAGFTAAKTAVLFYAVYASFRASRTWILVYAAALFLFSRAALANLLNYLLVGP